MEIWRNEGGVGDDLKYPAFVGSQTWSGLSWVKVLLLCSMERMFFEGWCYLWPSCWEKGSVCRTWILWDICVASSRDIDFIFIKELNFPVSFYHERVYESLPRLNSRLPDWNYSIFGIIKVLHIFYLKVAK